MQKLQFGTLKAENDELHIDELALRKRIFSLDQQQFPGFDETQEKDSKNTSGAKMGRLSTLDS